MPTDRTDYADSNFVFSGPQEEWRELIEGAGMRVVAVNATYMDGSHGVQIAVPPSLRKPANPQAEEKVEEKFKIHKLVCDACGSPLRLLGGRLATCDFCHSQFYLEGFNPDTPPPEPMGYSEPRYSGVSAYWADGGVSIRAIDPYAHGKWMEWED